MQSPVLLIAFNRPEHTRNALQALLVQNPKELYIFQDGPRKRNQDDVDNCTKVRQVISDLTCKTNTIVHTHYSNYNRGCREAIIYAISFVLKEYESVIVVEDDIITSPAFLTYMNGALEYYWNRKTVHSISGYSPSPSRFTVPDSYCYDVYASPRLFGWGWGTWRDRWENVDWSMNYYDKLMEHPEEINAFNRGGEDMMRMLTDEKEGRSSAWDVLFVFDQFKNHMVSIVPCISYTKNIGCDGSGTHCVKDDSKQIEGDGLNTKREMLWLDNLYFDRVIINRLHSVFDYKKRPIWKRLCNGIARKLGKKVPFQVKASIYA